MQPQPLVGIRVVELAEVWAGPMASSLLGDLGAEVVKIESYPRAPMTRPAIVPASRRGFVETEAALQRPWDASASHNMANRNKLGMAVNLRTDDGLRILKDLVGTCDVLVEGYSAGTMERLGIHYAALRKVRPDLIVVTAPGWGTDGPYRRYVTLGSGLDAYSGHWTLRCYPGSDATEVMSVFHTDAIAALTIAFAVVSAIHYRNRTGKGQWIDVSQAEAFLPHLSKPIMDYVMNGRVPTAQGNRNSNMAPQGVYKCRGEDHWLAVSVRDDADWEALCGVMGNEELAGDPRFSDVLSRLEHHDQLDRVIGLWTARQDKNTAMESLQAAGVPAGTVLNEPEVLEDPHLASRGFFQQVAHPVAGTHMYPGQLWRLSESPANPHSHANTLGEHNRYVLEELLGRSTSEVDALEEVGVIGDAYALEADVDAQERRVIT